ncbi:MAG: VOC family protein [Thaumarchaeota archaeon]|nr:VOC family protein [Nitrososphaerota archaeon]
MKLGPPTLRVKNLDEAVAFYQNDLGFQVNIKHREADDGLEVLELGFKNHDGAILTLKHDPNAKTTSRNFAGLYHYAVLVPDRRSLASTYLAIGNSGATYEGFADHTVSESLYLHDVERNGIEIYADRPKNTWPRFIELMKRAGSDDIRKFLSLNKPLDFSSLLGELSMEERNNPSHFPSGARIGHIHLRVTDLERSVKFYHERLGLDIIGNLPEIGAAFLSVGGYHHHIGLNTWHSLGGNPHEEGEAGLENFKIIVPDKSAQRSLASRFPDSPEESGELSIAGPDGIRIVIESASEP